MEYRSERRISPVVTRYTFLYALALEAIRKSTAQALTLMAMCGLLKNDNTFKEEQPSIFYLFSSEEMINLHMYHYAGNNPVKYTDPDGEDITWVDAFRAYSASKNKGNPNLLDKIIIKIGDKIISDAIINANEALRQKDIKDISDTSSLSDLG